MLKASIDFKRNLTHKKKKRKFQGQTFSSGFPPSATANPHPTTSLRLLKQDHEILNFKAFNSTESTSPENMNYPNWSELSILKTFKLYFYYK